MASEKTPVIEYLFSKRFDEKTKSLRNPVVSKADVSRAIRATRAPLSTDNPANFFKDIVRSKRRNDHFPESVLARGYTAEQFVSDRNCFRFIPLPKGQVAAFADLEPDPDLLEFDAIHPIQSISLPLASRRMGRSDESWLTQVAVRLHVIDTHLALYSALPLINLDLLQTGAKLGRSEIDAVFLALLTEPRGETKPALVSCEVKSRTEMLEAEQVLRGAETVARQKKKLELPDDTLVIPIAIKALGDGLMWVVEFDTTFPPLTQKSERVYRFEPAVNGVG